MKVTVNQLMALVYLGVIKQDFELEMDHNRLPYLTPEFWAEYDLLRPLVITEEPR